MERRLVFETSVSRNLQLRDCCNYVNTVCCTVPQCTVITAKTMTIYSCKDGKRSFVPFAITVDGKIYGAHVLDPIYARDVTI